MNTKHPASGATGESDTTTSESAAESEAQETLSCAHCGKAITRPIISYTCMCHRALTERAAFIARQVRHG